MAASPTYTVLLGFNYTNAKGEEIRHEAGDTGVKLPAKVSKNLLAYNRDDNHPDVLLREDG